MDLPNRARLAYPAPAPSGADLDAVVAGLAETAGRLRRSGRATGTVAIALRLPARAAGELAAPGRLEQFRKTLADLGLRVVAGEASPYEDLRGDEERLRYTALAACLLARLLPSGGDGSLSSAPCPPGGRVAGRADEEETAAGLRRVAEVLWRLSYIEGRTVALGLQTKPRAWPGDARQAVRFLERRLFCRPSVSMFSRRTGLPADMAEDTLRRHVGVCLDSQQLGDAQPPEELVRSCREAGVRIVKAFLGGPSEHAERLARALSRLADPPSFEIPLPN